MAHFLQFGRRLGATFVVLLGFWLMGGEQAHAGCGDHGYIVKRDNGDVVVVTPSNPKCPCKGPKCHKPEIPAGPMVPTAPPPFPVDEAWHMVYAKDVTTQTNKASLPPHQENCLTGHPGEILHPPPAPINSKVQANPRLFTFPWGNR